jgi:hypothetical protein
MQPIWSMPKSPLHVCMLYVNALAEKALPQAGPTAWLLVFASVVGAALGLAGRCFQIFPNSFRKKSVDRAWLPPGSPHVLVAPTHWVSAWRAALRRPQPIEAAGDPHRPAAAGQTKLAQDRPKSWAKFRPLIGIIRQKSGPIRADPVELTFSRDPAQCSPTVLEDARPPGKPDVAHTMPRRH